MFSLEPAMLRYYGLWNPLWRTSRQHAWQSVVSGAPDPQAGAQHGAVIAILAAGVRRAMHGVRRAIHGGRAGVCKTPGGATR